MKKIFTLFCFFLTFHLYAQQTITGTVTNEKGETLVGASVWIKGTTQGTLSDEKGNYTIKTDKNNAFLSFSFAGMQPSTKEIGDSKTINAVLGETTLDEFVVIDYGSCIRTCKIQCGFIIEFNSFSARFNTFTEKPTLELRTLGNPFTNHFALEIKSETDEKAVVSLYNIEGKLVKGFETNLNQGDNRLEMNDLSNLASGFYNVSVNLISKNESPEIIEKSSVKTIPNELFKKITALNPQLLKYPNNEVLPLSKTQYELLIQSDKLEENIGKVKSDIMMLNPNYDSWDIESDAYVEEADQNLYPNYKKEMTKIFFEYRHIMTNSVFKEIKKPEDYDIEDFESALFFKSNNILLIQNEVISKKKVYSQVLVKK